MMKPRVPQVLAAGLAAVLLVGCTEGGESSESARATANEQTRVVGSSTVYPYASYVAGELGATTDYPPPIIESTGTGGGIKLFCAGDGPGTPDIVNASRPMTVEEFERCQANGVTSITEVVFGLDGIVLGQAKENPSLNLTLEQLMLAVAAEVPQNGELVPNPYDTWSEIDPSLPDHEILIYGPPTTSGTREAFEELVMVAASEQMPGYPDGYSQIRQDGRYVPTGENDNLIVQKVAQNKEAFGIFGYTFLVENRDQVEAITIDGVAPTPKTISSGAYPIARSLYFYTKNSHFGETPGMEAYVELFTSDRMIGPHGLLTDLGLIPLPETMREQMRERIANRVPLTRDDLVTQ